MSFVLLIRENGNVTYLNKLFSSEAEAYEFVKSHSIGEGNYHIASEAEFQAYMAEQQAQQRTGYRGGYHQHVDIIDDQREPEQQPRQQRPVIQNYRPAFVHPTFIGKKKRWG